MLPLSFLKRSQTTIQISRYLLPLGLIAAVAFLLSIGTYALMFFPAQVRLSQTTAAYKTAQQAYVKRKTAWETQQTLEKFLTQMPDRKNFTGLSVAIASLAKTHRIRIPGMGYDIQELRHNLGTKGILSFKAAGRYNAIRKFIFELESKWPHLFIEKLSAERAKKSNDVAFTIKVSTFLKDTESTPGQGSSSL